MDLLIFLLFISIAVFLSIFVLLYKYKVYLRIDGERSNSVVFFSQDSDSLHPLLASSSILKENNAPLPNSSFKPPGVKRLKHLKTKEEKHNFWLTRLKLQNQKALKDAQDVDLRCMRELELEGEKTSELREMKHDEEMHYLLLAESIQLIDQGCDVSNSDLSLINFVSYITCNKIVLLEDLASKFNTNTQIVVERIIRMIEMGNLNGIFDDRGRFIQIRGSDFKELASIIRKHGRVSIADISSATNQIFNHFNNS